jgi:hypothetical protein
MNGTRDTGCELGQSFMTGVAKTPMPQQGRRLGDQGVCWWKVEWVQGPGDIAPDDLSS